jgi:hypothetical protein
MAKKRIVLTKQVLIIMLKMIAILNLNGIFQLTH